ncbi:MAG: GNAT family N-acetyltransferase [Neisseria sp.]|nr:GNAT family N-acetyltransferase [Neisseria sp.]
MQVRIIPLDEQPQHIQALAQALHTEWHDFAPWRDLETILAYYARCLDGGGLPLAWLAVDGENRLLGSAALKRQDIAELPQYEYWLGDVFVLPEARGRGVGARLVEYALRQAREMALPELYLYTPDVQAVYAKYGWREIETRWHNGETVSVMRLVL